MIQLKNDILTVEISPVGAEIHHVIDKNGVERIWQNESGAWDSHTPLLFPIAGAIKDDTWYYEGKPYKMTKHGFVRRETFEVEEADESRAVLALTGEKMKHDGYPFDVELRVIYTLSGNSVIVDYKVTNVSDKEAYFSVGAHEGYACPGGIEKYELVFPEDDELDQTLLNGSLLRHETAAWKLDNHVLNVKPEDFKNDALSFLSAKSRVVTLRAKDGSRSVTVDFNGFDTLFIWQKVGEDYLCIEPWCNAPDFEDADQQLVNKPGMMKVEKGESRKVTHTLTFE
ncbi:MAG: aldose 1-epimerase family protein [Clostridia bacterium]|nr:aldose 1-epimerase family protein [Clostridia bacterium]